MRLRELAQYERYVEVMVNAGLVSDTSKLWWDLRPNARFPTLEMRVSDVCTHMTTQSRLRALCVPCPSTYPFENRESALESLRAESD